MNIFKKFGYRVYQKVMYVGMSVMPWRIPERIEGANSLTKIPATLLKNQKQKPLIVTDVFALERGALEPLFERLRQENFEFSVYSGVLPNPTIAQIEKGLKIFNSEKCDCIVAFGGGSVIDCAKIIGARAVKPNQTVEQMKGLIKIRKKLPLFIAVPTTAGTGSEVTVAAVISNQDTHHKYPINDFSLIPKYAVLDANLTVGLPKNLTSTTGMDALTHAVEAYIGKGNTKKTKQQAEKAVKLIFENIEIAYNQPTDLVARQNMQEAAFLAGLAFTRAYVGYVHALAHALGGKYGVPHGLANSILLPPTLLAFGKSAHKKLAKLADVVGLAKGKTTEQKAKEFITAIVTLNENMGIPNTIPAQYGVKAEDFAELVGHALKEANPLYPVPKIFGAEELTAIYKDVCN